MEDLRAYWPKNKKLNVSVNIGRIDEPTTAKEEQ
jgi:hypothetical protein